MKKTSVYLSDEDRERLREIAEREGKSQASVLREAIAAYGETSKPSRRFRFIGSGEGTGRSIADIPDDELMAGFGER